MIPSTRNVVLFAFVFVSVTACETLSITTQAGQEPTTHVIRSYADSVVAELTQDLSRDTTLFVFDIDNTLLQSPEGQLIGSDQWYKWQKSLPQESDRKVECLLQVQGAAYYMAHLQATEEGRSTQYVRQLQNAGFDVLALTARSPQFRPATERELSRNGFDFTIEPPLEHLGFPGSYRPKRSKLISKPRDASYQDGVAMLAGQHKGAALIDLLERIGGAKTYRNLVFFDDDQKNTDAMSEAFSGGKRSAIVFLYKAVDTDIRQYDLGKTALNQAALLSAFHVFRREFGCDI